MIKSLRLRIQIWHAIILVVVVTVFSVAFHRQLHRATMGEIDAELLSGARVLEGTLRALSPHELESNLDQAPLTIPRRFERLGGPPRPPRPSADEAGPPPDRPPWRDEVPPYFAVFNSKGELMRSSAGSLPTRYSNQTVQIEYRNLDGRREIRLRGPGETLIVVGRDVRPQMDRLRGAMLQLLGLATLVLTLGLVGGWWLSGRAIEPINRMSDTATKISAANLAQRMDTSKMDEELRSLGAVLNSMLGRLEHSFEQQTQFTADASHELRTPLAVLLSHCELALSRPRGTEEYQQTIATCQKAAQRMRGLVEGLLVLARADAGKLELHRSRVDLRMLADEAKVMFDPLAQEHQIELAVTGDTSVCDVDANRISQTIFNLVHNAIVYNRPQGKVTIETATDEGDAIIRVRDTGMGITSDAIPHLFDRFYRVDEARSRETGGSGLGLAICKSIIDAHSGSLTVESKLDQGSIFTVKLPRPDQPD